MRALSFASEVLSDTLRHRGTQTQFVVVVSWVSYFLCRGVPLPAVHSQSVEDARELGMHECRWGRNGECSGQFCYLLPFFQLRATEKGHCTLMSGKKCCAAARFERLSLRGLYGGLLMCFPLKARSSSCSNRMLCRRPSRYRRTTTIAPSPSLITYLYLFI